MEKGVFILFYFRLKKKKREIFKMMDPIKNQLEKKRNFCFSFAVNIDFSIVIYFFEKNVLHTLFFFFTNKNEFDGFMERYADGNYSYDLSVDFQEKQNFFRE
jgi:hypothetical protein